MCFSTALTRAASCSSLIALISCLMSAASTAIFLVSSWTRLLRSTCAVPFVCSAMAAVLVLASSSSRRSCSSLRLFSFVLLLLFGFAPQGPLSSVALPQRIFWLGLRGPLFSIASPPQPSSPLAPSLVLLVLVLFFPTPHLVVLVSQSPLCSPSNRFTISSLPHLSPPRTTHS